MNSTLSPENQQKLIAINQELKVMQDKYGFDLGAVAFLLPDGRVGARPEVFFRKEEGANLSPTNTVSPDASIDTPAEPSIDKPLAN